MAFLFNSDIGRAAIFREIFARELPDLEFFHSGDAMEPEKVRYLITWTVPGEISRYRNLEVLFSIGAGVDQFKADMVPGHVKVGPHGRGRHHSHDAGIRRPRRAGASQGNPSLSRAAEKARLEGSSCSAGPRIANRLSRPWHAGAGGNRAPEAVPVSACRVEPQRKADRGSRLLSRRGPAHRFSEVTRIFSSACSR